ncbi:uncharacterized protein LOC116775506 [Danaus plexippus]|uniref:uncharacterized protein LOC116775506 n=1 Tax=Danaus plexippus TaxID=13037 RepID=UPI002AAF5816|nr:uncharacterized protein LOC116775506 [Danaus plexippus]XP_061377332.1 uncharacterized protein LOC116775506 [Danaus plexippus]
MYKHMKMTVLLVFGLFVVIVTAHNITYLEVPQYGDPRRDADLICHYVNEKGDPPLHSVKWYRDNNEIFRFTPEQQPPTRTFNTTAGGVSRGFCNMHSCSISVVLPKKYNTRISFTCEVSTEGPRFAVVNQTKYLTVAVTLKEDPVITGASGSVQQGEDVLLNCSTKPAMPPANIVWFIDGRPEKHEPWINDNTEESSADEFGLRSSWRALRVRATTIKGYITVRCEATQPTRPPYTRSSNATLNIARSPHLSMYTASGSSVTQAIGVATVCLSLHIFSKFSALCKV